MYAWFDYWPEALAFARTNPEYKLVSWYTRIGYFCPRRSDATNDR